MSYPYPFYPSQPTGIEDIDALEGLFGNIPILGQIENTVNKTIESIPIIGDVHKAVTGAIQSVVPAVPAPPLIGAALGNPVQALAQGVNQAAGDGAAQSPLGAILGMGLGGALPGTGPLPGMLGQISSQLFGGRSIPPAREALAQIGGTAMEPIYDQLAHHGERVGRAIVTRVIGAQGPMLDQISAALRTAATQTQATAEHRDIQARDDWKRRVLDLLLGISQRTTATPVQPMQGVTRGPSINIIRPDARGMGSLPGFRF